MIRQDYLMRLAQRLAQALAQALFHKGRQEYELAEAEIDAAVGECLDGKAAAEIDLETVLAGCQAEGPSAPDNIIRLADLLREKGEIQRLRGDLGGATRAEGLALGLFLEVLQTRIVSLDLIQKTEELIERTSGASLPAPVLERLLRYYEARGKLAEAEDVLYDWLATKDPAAPEGGLSFYERASARSDEELTQGGLSRAEVNEGRAEWSRRSNL